MNINPLIFYYLIIINLISGIIFSYDKFAAVKKRKRIRESLLQLFEGFGGAFMNLLLMYVLHHKRNKPLYYLWTWFFMSLWIIAVLLIVLR